MSHADSRSRMSRSDWALTAVAASVVMALGGLGYAISTQKPQRDGQVNVQGLAAPVTGRIVKLLKEPGDRVAAGDGTTLPEAVTETRSAPR